MSNNLIPKLDANTSYEYFYNEFLVKNRVCLFDEHFTKDWISRKEWVESEGKPNLNLLNGLFGKALVPVSDCNTKYYNSNAKQDMTFSDYINYWQKVQHLNHKYHENGLQILYLKDWHFVKQFPDYMAYKTPIYFESDWINEYLISSQFNDDFQFVYMGPKDSSTPLHTDVFGSFSWSANICGTKKWLIIPAGNEERIKNLNNKEMPHDFYSIPNYMIQLKALNGFEVIQKTGEIIFIPSGFIHQVINTEDTISINHNWFNACNVENILLNILKALNEVENELSDLKQMMSTFDFKLQCQTILKLHFGMNFNEFIDCLYFISERIQNELIDKDLKLSQLSFRVNFDQKALFKVLNIIKLNSDLLEYKPKLNEIEEKLTFS